MVSIWLDDVKVGCGERSYLVISVGPKWATLLQPAMLTEVKVDRPTFERHAERVSFVAKGVRRLIIRNTRQARRLRLQHPAHTIKTALAMLAARTQPLLQRPA
jgi:hypothetical protein